MNALRNLRLIITGCPCSGTHWTAWNLKEYYGFEAEHESFDYKRESLEWWSPKGVSPEIDISHVTGQWLDAPELATVPIFHIVRDPVAVFNSYLGATFDTDGSFDANRVAGKLAAFNANIQDADSRLKYRYRVDAKGSLEALVREILELPIPWTRNQPLHLEPFSRSNAHNFGRFNFSLQDIHKLDNGPAFLDPYSAWGYKV